MTTIIKNAKILIEKHNMLKLENHDIIIKNSRIEGLDTNIKEYQDNIIDINGQILLPLFFNIHCHLGESLYKINGKNWNLSKYLKYTSNIVNKMNKIEQNRAWNDSAEFTVKKLLETGTGGFCAARSADIAKKYNICTMAGYPLMLSKKLEEYRNAGIEGYAKYFNQKKSPFCSVGIFLHSLYKANNELLQLASQCFDYNADFITVHISEDVETRKLEIERFKKLPVFTLNEFGLLTDRTILIHCGLLSDEELSLIKEKNAVIAVCPISNIFLNTKIIDINNLEKYNIRWCIATDGLATGKTFSIIEQAMKLKEQFSLISYEKIFRAITTVPAKIFNRDIYSGLIEKNVESSFIVVHNCADYSIQIVLEKLFSGELSWEIIRI
ncbi:MAG: amidohydrolase family protein [Ruminococcus sp.]|nr:amidohydrolase family protein [Ruminococcus sp.]